jgi:putative holliday junction resolvase
MRVLGIDYGRRRIGLAISDEAQFLARPLEPFYRTHSLAKDLASITRLARDLGAGTVVVGLPLNMDGSKGEMALEVEAFVTRLNESSGFDVLVFDERLTSSEAERVLLEGDVKRKDRKRLRDGLAATLILQGFLDSRPQPT